MADDDTSTQTQPAPAPAALPAGMTMDQINALAQQFMPQMPQRDMTPVKRSWTSLLGEHIAGGPPTPGMTPAEQEAAGSRALIDFGTSLAAASQYSPGQTIFSNLAQGFRGAREGEVGSAQMAMAQLGAQQDWALKQQQAHLEALKTALPLLQLWYRQSLPSPFAGNAPGGGGAPPGGGAAPGGGSYLTGDKAKDLPLIAQHESGGDPTALNYVARADPSAYARGATASGKYQMVNSTWQEGAKLAGVDTSQYPTAMSAPEDVQDKVAGAVYDKYGTKPWDASKFTQQWVPTPTGQMILAKAAPGTKAGGPQPPAPYKVAGLPVAPPSAPTAPASTGLPVPPTPPAPSAGVVSQGELPGAESGAAGPPASTATPPAQPAPQQTTPPVQPLIDLKSRPDTDLNEEEFYQKHRIPLTPEQVQTYAPGPANQLAVDRARQVQQAQADAQAARNAFMQARQVGSPDADKLFTAMNAADKAAQDAEKDYDTAVQGLQTAGAANLLKADTDEKARLSAAYKSQVVEPRNAAALAAQNAAATAALEKQKADAAIEQAKITSGLTIEQKGAETALADSQQKLTDMAKASTEARTVGNQLRLMPGIIDQLPQPGFAAQLAKDHPALIPYMTQAGALSPEQATASQVMQGLIGYMSVGLRPTGSGALRNAEMDRFQRVLPDMMQDPSGRRDSLGLLQTLQDRIAAEQDFASKYFRRIDPATGKPAYNLDGLDDAIDAPKSQGGLGPIAPTGPPPVTKDANGQAQKMTPAQVQQWVHDNVGEGHAYWGWTPKGDGTYQQKLMVRRDHG